MRDSENQFFSSSPTEHAVKLQNSPSQHTKSRYRVRKPLDKLTKKGFLKLNTLTTQIPLGSRDSRSMLLVDYIRKASLIGALLPYSFDKSTLTSIFGMASFGSDLVLRHNQDSHWFSVLQAKNQKTQHDLLYRI